MHAAVTFGKQRRPFCNNNNVSRSNRESLPRKLGRACPFSLVNSGAERISNLHVSLRSVPYSAVAYAVVVGQHGSKNFLCVYLAVYREVELYRYSELLH